MDRPLLLNGFMGTGKTTVGRALASLSGHAFVDLDARIEERAGRSIPELFASVGEDGFRALENESLCSVLAEGGAPIVALGGGALLRRAHRLDALDRAVVVTLEASVDEILRRTATSDRPLLQGNSARESALRLLELRHPAYVEAHATIRTDARAVDDIAADVLALWRRDPLVVAAGEHSYCVEIGDGIAPKRVAACVHPSSLTLVISDENVAAHHTEPIAAALQRAGLRQSLVVLPPGEEHKDLASLERIWSAAFSAGADRKSVVVGIGGGVVTDVAGFAAATWMRGIRWYAVPTTLLAMVDASVGGKTAIDLAHAKNCVGAFWQPSAVICDVGHLRTEPVRGFASALAEVIKTALIGDPELLDLVEEQSDALVDRDPVVAADIVRRSVRVKARVVSADEREGGLRACLNLGHTIGHALEAYGGYGRLRHGEAVSLGLVAALLIGQKLGLTDKTVIERTVDSLRRVGLPVNLAEQPLLAAVDLIEHDKKRSGRQIRFVVARAVGNVELIDVAISDLRRYAAEIAG